MEILLLVIFSLFSGAFAMYFVVKFYHKFQLKSNTEKQSVVLIEKIKKVCKLVVIEGEFAEIYDHRHDQGYFFGLLISKKKALVKVRAMVHIGFDLQKLKMNVHLASKTIILSSFPQPEVISLESDIEFYDVKDGFLNKFKPDDFSQVNKQAKQFVMDKIPEGSLMGTARKEALETLQIIQGLVETIGWKLDISTIELPLNKTTELSQF